MNVAFALRNTQVFRTLLTEEQNLVNVWLYVSYRHPAHGPMKGLPVRVPRWCTVAASIAAFSGVAAGGEVDSLIFACTENLPNLTFRTRRQ